MTANRSPGLVHAGAPLRPERQRGSASSGAVSGDDSAAAGSGGEVRIAAHRSGSNAASTGILYAEAALILVHGRGATAQSMIPLARDILPEAPHPAKLAILAPQAPGNAWYPYPFIAEITHNEPRLSNSLRALADLLAEVDLAGIPPERVMLLGFSQGACLALEYAVRHPQRYGGIAALSGGLIGPPGTPWDTPGTLDGTPIFLGCSDVDPHIPAERVTESAQVLEGKGARVTARLYPGMGHTVNPDEIDFVKGMIQAIVAGL